ncbi:uncharacterized protein [Argopecten irradians]|uniref:uncharacterized protein n=1 Tax=Argopecten irradians TaxID=31199 RepID=UPI003711F9D5
MPGPIKMDHDTVGMDDGKGAGVASGGPGNEQVKPGVKIDPESPTMSDDDMIRHLLSKGKYVISTKGTVDGTGIKPSAIPPLDRGRSSSISFLNSTSNDGTSSFSGNRSHTVPKIPPFSGDDPPMKGDISYMEWRFEIRSLDRDSDVSPSLLIQAIRRSLRGTARRMIMTLGKGSTVPQILSKLCSLFGDTSTHGMVMQNFFNSKQRPDECVVNFGCRLESLLQTAIDNGSLHRSAKNDLLRHKFWTSLYSDQLRSQTRHKYDSITSYDQLLREIRMVEKEINISKQDTVHSTDNKKKVKSQSHSVTCELEQQQVTTNPSEISKDFQNKLKDVEDRLSARIDQKFDQILSKLGNAEHGKSGQGHNKGQGQRSNRGRGYRGNRNNPKSGQDKGKSKEHPNN